jgi:AcrR family transcriptional regulator
MPRRSREYMDGQRRRFCDAAIRCFKLRGVVATNLTMICEETGLSMGAFYKLYSSRDDLLADVYLTRFVDRNERLHGATWAQLRKAMLAYREKLAQEAFWREMDGMADWDPRLLDLRVRQAKIILGQIVQQLKRYQAAGEIQPALDLDRTAQLVSIIFDGSTSFVRQASQLHVSPQDLARFLDLAVGAVQATPPRRTTRRLSSV